MRRPGLLVLPIVLSLVAGCSKGGASDTKKVAVGSTAAPTMGPSGPVLVKAELVSAGTRAAAGDTITLTFSKEVVLADGATDPAAELLLPVAGNSFGAGATLAPGASPTDLVVTLGQSPNLRISGAFDVAHVGSGDASGIDLPSTPTGHLATATGEAPSASPADLGGPFVEGWAQAALMQTPRGGHTATALPDGRILIVGGLQLLPAAAGQPATPGYCLDSEVFDPIANSFTKTKTLGGTQGDMLVAVTVGGQPRALPVARTNHTATLLDDGRVLIVGGFGFERVSATGATVEQDLSSAHVFDPATNRFTVVPSPLRIPRSRHAAVKLPDGQVLIAGGVNNAVPVGNPPKATAMTLPEAELFDPVANTFTPLSATGNDMKVPRMDGAALLDPASGQVLFSGGIAIATPSGATQPALALCPGAEVFDPASKAFAEASTRAQEDVRWQAAAATSGGVVMLGGAGAAGAVANVDVLRAGAITAGPALASPRARARASTIGGSIVVVAGGSSLSGNPGHELATCEVLNAETLTVQAAPAMQNARNNFTLTEVGGRVFAIGGWNGGQGQNTASSDGQPVGMAEVYSRP